MKKSLKYALIGPGRMGINYALTIQKQSNNSLVAICGNRKKSTMTVYQFCKWANFDFNIDKSLSLLICIAINIMRVIGT